MNNLRSVWSFLFFVFSFFFEFYFFRYSQQKCVCNEKVTNVAANDTQSIFLWVQNKNHLKTIWCSFCCFLGIQFCICVWVRARPVGFGWNEHLDEQQFWSVISPTIIFEWCVLLVASQMHCPFIYPTASSSWNLNHRRWYEAWAFFLLSLHSIVIYGWNFKKILIFSQSFIEWSTKW